MVHDRGQALAVWILQNEFDIKFKSFYFQHDRMLPNLTVWETLMFVSHFTLNEDESSKEERVNKTVKNIFQTSLFPFRIYRTTLNKT